jgi:hypothetical protein
VLAGLSVAALTLTSSGFAVVNLDNHSAGLRDFDSRGKVAPTKGQLRAAHSIHGHVSCPRDTEVHVTEVEVFGQNPTVAGSKVTTG